MHCTKIQNWIVRQYYVCAQVKKKGTNMNVHGLKNSLFSYLQENLRYYVDKVFREIVRSSISCPTLMCDVFYSLRHLAAKRFPSKCSLKTSESGVQTENFCSNLMGIVKILVLSKAVPWTLTVRHLFFCQSVSYSETVWSVKRHFLFSDTKIQQVRNCKTAANEKSSKKPPKIIEEKHK